MHSPDTGQLQADGAAHTRSVAIVTHAGAVFRDSVFTCPGVTSCRTESTVMAAWPSVQRIERSRAQFCRMFITAN